MKKREGVVKTYTHHNKRIGAMVVVSTITDFVSRNQEFLDFVDHLLLTMVANNVSNFYSDLYETAWIYDENLTVLDVIQEQNKKFGETILVDSFVVWNLDE